MQTAWKWVGLELREIPKWMKKKKFETEGKPVSNSVPWLLWATLAKVRLTKKKHKACRLPTYHHRLCL